MAFLKLTRGAHQAVISGQVIDAKTQAPIEHVAVQITTMSTAARAWLDAKAGSVRSGIGVPPSRAALDITDTGEDGSFCFIDLPDGDYGLTFTPPCKGTRHGTAQQTVTVKRDATGVVAFAMPQVSLPPTAVTGIVTGKLQGSTTTTPLSLARIVVRGTGEKAYGDADGRFYLTGVEAGTRTLEVRASGYAVTLTTAAVVAGQITDIGTVVLDLPPP